MASTCDVSELLSGCPYAMAPPTASTLAAAAGVETTTSNAKVAATSERIHIFDTVRKSAWLFRRSEAPL